MNVLAELQICGTPDQCFEKHMTHHQLVDSGGLIGIFSYGDMPHDLAKQNMRVFAEKVMPRLKAVDTGSEIGGGAALTVAAE